MLLLGDGDPALGLPVPPLGVAEELPDVLLPLTPPLDCWGEAPELPAAPGEAWVLLLGDGDPALGLPGPPLGVAEELPDVLLPVTAPLDCWGEAPELPAAPGEAWVLLFWANPVVVTINPSEHTTVKVRSFVTGRSF